MAAEATPPPRKLFGTDGVRGVAGELVTAELALALGRAATERLDAARPRVLVIRDTRESGEMLESAVAAGVAAAGGEALLAGVLPTPAAPLIVQRHGLDLAAVISASHNPYGDNGIKFFGADGFKLSDALEAEIEAALDQAPRAGAEIGRVRALHNGLEDYLGTLEARFGELSLRGRRVLLDCANGATHRAAPEIFQRLGADVRALADEPDGRNINDGCGSTHLEPLREAMRAGGADVGFAFDGDGDRVLAVDRHGAVVDGDELIALAAQHLAAGDRLPGRGVAVTVMTNYGFHQAMRAAGIEVCVTPVGDRAVLEAMRERGWTLGGEQSGHIIDLGFAPSGDGIAAALLCFEALAGADLAGRAPFERLPQTLVNVRIADRDAYATASAVHAAVAAEGRALEGRGRVLVRPSGTEPLIRVMAEAPSEDEARAVCDRLVAVVRSELGSPNEGINSPP